MNNSFMNKSGSFRSNCTPLKREVLLAAVSLTVLLSTPVLARMPISQSGFGDVNGVAQAINGAGSVAVVAPIFDGVNANGEKDGHDIAEASILGLLGQWRLPVLAIDAFEFVLKPFDQRMRHNEIKTRAWHYGWHGGQTSLATGALAFPHGKDRVSRQPTPRFETLPLVDLRLEGKAAPPCLKDSHSCKSVRSSQARLSKNDAPTGACDLTQAKPCGVLDTAAVPLKFDLGGSQANANLNEK